MRAEENTTLETSYFSRPIPLRVILLLALAFPGVLLALMLAMERVERPLRDQSVGDDIADFLESARPDEVETFISQGLANSLDRYWRRRGLRAKLLSRRLAARS